MHKIATWNQIGKHIILIQHEQHRVCYRERNVQVAELLKIELKLATAFVDESNKIINFEGQAEGVRGLVHKTQANWQIN